MPKRLLLAAAAIAGATAPAFAHVAPGEHGSFLAGVAHPISGADHVLAMVAVGLWAGTIGGRALWAVPAAFVATMLLGFAVALAGVPLPLIEPAILASVVVIGLLVAFAARPPLGASAALVAFFALFHGYAHGGELAGAGALGFASGFALSTALLHAAGLGLGVAMGSGSARGSQLAPRLAGGVTALAGVALMVAG